MRRFLDDGWDDGIGIVIVQHGVTDSVFGIHRIYWKVDLTINVFSYDWLLERRGGLGRWSFGLYGC